MLKRFYLALSAYELVLGLMSPCFSVTNLAFLCYGESFYCVVKFKLERFEDWSTSHFWMSLNLILFSFRYKVFCSAFWCRCSVD